MTTQILPVVVIFLNILLAIFVFGQNTRSSSNQLFALLAFLGALWTFANLMTDLFVSIFWLKTTYAFGSLIISVGLTWVLLLTGSKNDKKWWRLIIFIAFIFSILSYQDGFITKMYGQTFSKNIFVGSPGWGLTIYAIFYFSIAILIILKLYISIRKNSDMEKRRQYKYVLIGASITLVVTAFSSFIIPQYFSIFVFSSLDAIGFLIFLTFIAYSITRHHLFNIRVIAIEMVTFGLWITILVRTLLATTVQDRLIEGGLLVVTVIFGITLIRSTLHVIWQRERIEKLAENLGKAYDSLKDLNTNLEQKVAEQTHEIKRAYEVEKEARRELERLDETKNQLITAAQHNLRTPLTALRWQLEVIRKDADALQHGESSNTATASMTKKGFQEAIKESEDSVVTLTQVLEDFLDITALKVGGKGLKM